ncbi:MAG TPA: dihydropteroate synthase [Microthrixaceae bacterium]|nr:dihydropteroate synthase [Microthrixaceae bacterium]HMU80064.1 dihydropteroate synthase [Microthrixaceae bacterium]HMV74265.1 dihydropteroate synthase [Microthrixaceae bacterium]HMX06198.1 dihydropteroate synthase [Microthrixaceae bacterium]HMX64224.1 dihydropteroate synthase [Microthrixaceae bacterium]
MDRPLVMGILNVTPDSFSDGGVHDDVERARARTLEMIAEGVDVVDVGGESTRPGAAPTDPGAEQARVLPVIEAILEPCRAAGVRLSIDTRHESTARAALAAGATLLNDVSASLAGVAAQAGAGWIAMHMVGDPRTMQVSPRYDDVVAEVFGFLRERAAAATAMGVSEVWVDPGIGFAKTTAHNLALLAHLDDLVADGTPVVVGTSRKRMLGVLAARSDAGLAPFVGDGDGGGGTAEPPPVDVSDRLAGSLSTATWAMILGARMVRVHDVGATARVLGVVAAARAAQRQSGV